MKQYPAYKPSGVEWLGNVPAHWEVKRLKSVVESVINGVWGEEAVGDETDLVCVRVADFDYVALGVSSKKLTTRFIAEKERKNRLLSTGDILIERSGGGETQLVGRVIQYTLKEAAVCSNFISKLEVNREKVSRRFFTYMFAGLYSGRLNYPHIKQTTGIQNLDLASYLNEVLAFPPLPEQRAIAAFLDERTAHLDGLIRRKEHLLKLLAEQRAALITRAVTRGLDAQASLQDSGVAWLGQVPAHWAVKRLKFALAAINPVGSRLPLADDALVSFVPMTAVGEYGGLSLEAEKPLDEIGNGYTYFADGDVVVAKITPCFENGKGALATGLTNGVAFGTTELHVLRPNAIIDKQFLFLLTISEPFRKIGEGEMLGAGGQKRVPEEFIKNLMVPLPPLAEQKQIVESIGRINQRLDKMTDLTHQEIARLREYRAALITAAVTGRLDVRG